MNDDLCYKLNYLARLILSKVNEKIKPHGVTQGQLPVLCCLHDAEGQTQAELCKNIQVEQPTMANTLRRMERDGLIFRTASDKDKRQSRVYITERTRPTVKALQEKRDEVVAAMVRHMSPEDLATFTRLLDVATKALENPETE
ncbi:MarR family transcriptional regulator [Geobacter sulfurreducens]|uniref:MarR family winged helix-turn-helix transcriptional regulator n=1 Tax=Geobacter sulfurreducens TaxID=35554 RepID=UPI0001D8F318|nr:MarR family transcriptional regulator [Geobacter sulfurreducens]ADI85346.1 winged helix-turn-helix transcriptional regulator, MarR family [Geobacter sulfurreducens KN400]AJY68883.1 MarR family transcriptional regulator [Geobacter sulfurreducens]QVW34412.1 MarR family transcriptional regulator [Geobacter sulfurreducens]